MTRYIKTDAIILKYSKYGELNRLFTFISPTIGIEQATAFGAEKTKSRFCSAIQPFTKLELLLNKNPKNNLLKLEEINNVDINSFIRTDIRYIYLASFYSDVLLNSYIAENEAKSYFYLISYSLDIINSKNLYRSFLFFSIKYIYLSGYIYSFDRCKKCGNIDDIYYFDLNDNSFLCSSCSKYKNYPLSKDGAMLFSLFFKEKYIYLKDVDVDKKYFDEIRVIINLIFRSIFNKKLKSFELLDQVF